MYVYKGYGLTNKSSNLIIVIYWEKKKGQVLNKISASQKVNTRSTPIYKIINGHIYFNSTEFFSALGGKIRR